MKTSFVPLINFILGAVSVLAFAPFAAWWLIYISLSIAIGLNFSNAKRPFLNGFCFGLGLFLFGVSWVYVSLNVYGGMPLWMGSIAVLGFAAILSLFPAMAFFASCQIANSLPTRLIIFPSLWTLFEWLRSWILTGFPWLELGASQTSSSAIALAPIGGVYLVSFVICAISASLVFFVTFLRASKPRSAVIIVVSWLLLIGMLQLLNDIEWTEKATNRPLQIRVVQANVRITDKWRPENRWRIINDYRRMSLSSDQSSPDLIVWPETALPMNYRITGERFWRELGIGVPLLTGIIDRTSEQTFNAAALICGEQHNVYHKRHLVPFGEYLPLRFLFQWVLDYLEFPMSDMRAGTGAQKMSCGDDLQIALSICYEDAFSNEHRLNVSDATLLVNISEDAWFGDSLAAHQRLQMAQMRAAEVQRPMVRSANTGPSGFIDHRGNVIKVTPQFERTFAQAQIWPRQGATPYLRLGPWVVYLCIFIVALMVIKRRYVQ